MNNAAFRASTPCAAPRVAYRTCATQELLTRPDTLAVLRFGEADATVDTDPRVLDVPLPVLDGSAAVEHWQVDAEVETGQAGAIHYARGGGWLFAALRIAESDCNHDIATTAEHAYRELCAFLQQQSPTVHVQRIWNYLDRINAGDGDAERYKHFCDGRARGMDGFFTAGYPAATAIGSPRPSGQLVVYCLAATHPGTRVENPRQTNAWRYPRQFGRTAPTFARAMRLPTDDALAISGTAAITGHESRHDADIAAQLGEIRSNIEALLEAGEMPRGLDANAPLKVYLRHPDQADCISRELDAHWPGVPRLLLHGDVCRHELLVEVDGWQFA